MAKGNTAKVEIEKAVVNKDGSVDMMGKHFTTAAELLEHADAVITEQFDAIVEGQNKRGEYQFVSVATHDGVRLPDGTWFNPKVKSLDWLAFVGAMPSSEMRYIKPKQEQSNS